MLPQQEPGMTSTATRKSLIQLLAAADHKGEANGQLYWDDGESLSELLLENAKVPCVCVYIVMPLFYFVLDSVEELKFSLLNFTLRPGELRGSVIWWGVEQPPNLGKVTVLGVFTPVSSVTVNKIVQNFYYNTISKV